MSKSFQFSLIFCLFFLTNCIHAMSAEFNNAQPKKIVIEKKCLKSTPCCHKVELIYADMSSDILILSSVEIAEKYWHLLDEKTKNHFMSNEAVYELHIKEYDSVETAQKKQ